MEAVRSAFPLIYPSLRKCLDETVLNYASALDKRLPNVSHTLFQVLVGFLVLLVHFMEIDLLFIELKQECF